MACPPARPTRRAAPRVRTRRIAIPAVIPDSGVSGGPAGSRRKHPRTVTGGGSIRSAQRETNLRPALRDRPPIKLTRTEFLGPTRYWARTSDPQLVDSGQCSHPFASVRLNRVVERNLGWSERSSERERTPILAILAMPCMPAPAQMRASPEPPPSDLLAGGLRAFF